MIVEFDERLGWLLLGCAIGFVFGYIVRSLRDIKEELDEVDDIVKGRQYHQEDEEGSIKTFLSKNIALLLVVILTAFAAFASQRASNNVRDNAECTQEYLSETIKALNQRTKYTRTQARANVTLQKEQARFLNVLLGKPPPTQRESQVAFENYVNSLQSFINLSDKAAEQARTNPYPTNTELIECIDSR